MSFKEIDLLTADINPFKKIGTDWFLLTAGKENDFNTMTASWGAMGVMWNKNIFTTVVRPSRHTFKFIEENDMFSISFFDEDNRNDLKFCGSHSGRDYDKCAETNLTPTNIDGVPTFEEAIMVFICKKIYRATINEESFVDNNLFKFYTDDPFHVTFIGEIVKAYTK